MSFTNPSPKTMTRIGRVASFLSIMMYVSYLAQIQQNLAGNKGSAIQPLVATFNCILWTVYGFLQKPKDKPIIIANLPGIFLAAITFFTSL